MPSINWVFGCVLAKYLRLFTQQLFCEISWYWLCMHIPFASLPKCGGAVCTKLHACLQLMALCQILHHPIHYIEALLVYLFSWFVLAVTATW